MSRINATTITGLSGAPTFTNGAIVTGVITATTLSGNATGLTGSPNITVGNLTVNGTQTIINTQILDVADKNIGIGSTSTPSDALVDGAGITIYGTTNKTLTWARNSSSFEYTDPNKFKGVIETVSAATTYNSAAGGGGGGVSIHRAYSIGPGLYSASVGAESGTGATSGNPSSFSNITSLGGGFGAGPAGGGPGGSGGGGQESTYPAGSGLQPSQNAPLTPNPNFSQYGNPGGNGQTTGFYAAGGGGGAGGAGGISPGPGPGGIGGPGIAVPGFEYNLVGISPVIPIANSPTNNHYGAGGGGWGYGPQPYPTGGGGRGGNTGPVPSQSGVNYLGGGAGNDFYANAPTKTGGSGIVIIRYLS